MSELLNTLAITDGDLYINDLTIVPETLVGQVIEDIIAKFPNGCYFCMVENPTPLGMDIAKEHMVKLPLHPYEASGLVNTAYLVSDLNDETLIKKVCKDLIGSTHEMVTEAVRGKDLDITLDNTLFFVIESDLTYNIINYFLLYKK